ncbi:hypothetical protein V8G54_033858 [Vigna mungo]|uniref:Uncharacterized protein n=1 Tax=Vigna mungo TaxID=3915 RepID=A0AAQ3MPR1_VIGMU
MLKEEAPFSDVLSYEETKEAEINNIEISRLTSACGKSCSSTVKKTSNLTQSKEVKVEEAGPWRLGKFGTPPMVGVGSSKGDFVTFPTRIRNNWFDLPDSQGRKLSDPNRDELENTELSIRRLKAKLGEIRHEVQPSWKRRVDLPIFEGFNPFGWISKAEKFFEWQGVTEEGKVRLASISMEGSAGYWVRVWKEKAKNRSLEGLKGAMVWRFGERNRGTTFEGVAASKQSGTVEEYVKTPNERGLPKPNGRSWPKPNERKLREPNGLVLEGRMKALEGRGEGRINGLERTMDSVRRGKRTKREVLKDIEDHFLKAYDSGKMVTKMLDAEWKTLEEVLPPPKPPDLNWRVAANEYPPYDNTMMERSQEIKFQISNLEDKVVLQRGVMLGYKVGEYSV